MIALPYAPAPRRKQSKTVRSRQRTQANVTSELQRERSELAVRDRVPSANVRIKRVYEPASEEDGARILVDRLWPRGISHDEARLDGWLREIAPSSRLRSWFGHDPRRWAEFRNRYRSELAGHADALSELRRRARERRITLLYGAKDELHNHAVVLRNVLLGKTEPGETSDER